jgi:hypothetical protein
VAALDSGRAKPAQHHSIGGQLGMRHEINDQSEFERAFDALRPVSASRRSGLAWPALRFVRARP